MRRRPPLQASEPFLDVTLEAVEVETIHEARVGIEIALSEDEKRHRWSRAVSPEVNKSTGHLDQTFVEVAFGVVPFPEPEHLQNLMSFEISAVVKAVKKSKVGSIRFLPPKGLGADDDLGACIRHG